jgi:hypothetical protein
MLDDGCECECCTSMNGLFPRRPPLPPSAVRLSRSTLPHISVLSPVSAIVVLLPLPLHRPSTMLKIHLWRRVGKTVPSVPSSA